jgi:hypothetical protein
MVVLPGVLGLALLVAAAVLFTAGVRNADSEHGSATLTGTSVVLGGCAAVLGCGCLIVCLGALYYAVLAAPMR